MPWSVKALIAIFMLIGLFFLTVMFFPFNDYIPEVESYLSRLSGASVKIGQMTIQTRPKVLFTLNEVRFENGKNQIHFEEIQILPDVWTILGSRKALRETSLRGVSLTPEKFEFLSSILAISAAQNAQLAINRIKLEKATIAYAGLVFPEMSGEVGLGTNRAFESISLKSPDNTLFIELKPARPAGLQVNLERYQWRFDPSYPLFRTVNIKGSLTQDILRIDDLELLVLNGAARGNAVIQTINGERRFQGKIDFERIDSTEFGNLLGINQRLFGEMSGQIAFSAASDSWETLFRRHPNLSGEFSIARGSFAGIDLANAVRLPLDTPSQGGETIFEQLSGKISTTPSAYSLSISLNSGLMQSSGTVLLSREGKLDGTFNLDLRGLSTPIQIGGTWDNITIQRNP